MCKEGFYGSGKSCIGNYEIYICLDSQRGPWRQIVYPISYLKIARGIIVLLKMPSKYRKLTTTSESGIIVLLKTSPKYRKLN